MHFNLFARKRYGLRPRSRLLYYLQSCKHPKHNFIKARWKSLLFLSVIASILLSNSNSVRLQSVAIATPVKPSMAVANTSMHANALPEAAVQDTPIPNQARSDNAASLDNKHELALLPASPQAILSQPGKAVTIEETKPLKRHSWVIRSGDTLTHILQRFGVYSSYKDILALGKKIKLLNLRPGKHIHLDVTNDGTLQKITYEKTISEHFIIERSNDKFFTQQFQLPIEKRRASKSAVIHKSFYQTGIDAGLDDDLIIEMAHILGWDIDFALDIRAGDSFSVIYEEEILDGIKIRNGKILAITLINRNKAHRALYYTDSQGRDGYYSPLGKSVKKPFLRTPLEFTRVSSKFSMRRLHPILKVKRPHRGVDYAAPTGTKVYATADGRVIYRGWKAGYGKVVILRHYNNYTTLYAHLSRFKRGLKVGSSVKQSETIAYVGMTGYATGPHLHYEFRVNGHHKNPLTVKLPDSKPLPTHELKQFKQTTQTILAQLHKLERRYAAH